MNTVTLIGRLTKDPTIKYANDLAIADFTLAIDRPPNRNGEKQTDFPRCKAFGKTAETIEKYVGKGQMIGVVGSIQTGSYENREGQTVYTTDVAVQRIDILEWKNRRFEGGNAPSGQMGRETQKNGSDTPKSSAQGNLWEQLDEDIPF